MQEQCDEKRDEIDLICSLLKGVEVAGNRWNGKPLQQITSETQHTLDRIENLLNERNEQAGDALNRISRFGRKLRYFDISKFEKNSFTKRADFRTF